MATWPRAVQGKSAEAEALYRDLLAKAEERKGPEDVGVARMQSHFALFLHQEGKKHLS